MTILWALAAAGGTASATWHIALLSGRGVRFWWLGIPLGAGLFTVWLAAVLRMGRREPWPPGRVRWLGAAACIVYAFVNMWLPAQTDLRMPLAATGHLTAFFALAAATLWAPPKRRGRPARLSRT